MDNIRGLTGCIEEKYGFLGIDNELDTCYYTINSERYFIFLSINMPFIRKLFGILFHIDFERFLALCSGGISSG